MPCMDNLCTGCQYTHEAASGRTALLYIYVGDLLVIYHLTCLVIRYKADNLLCHDLSVIWIHLEQTEQFVRQKQF